MNLQATFAATLVDEWVRGGVRHAVVAPGSRSTPLVLALLAHPGLTVHVRLDERSAAFYALGIGLSSGVPAVVTCTSGTASAELHAAVLEADLARVPLIVATADRPPELHHVGAPQTLEQDGLYGGAVRLFVSPGPADEAGRPFWRALGARLVAEARHAPAGPGPVHVNLAFRDPLVGEPGPLPPGRPAGAGFQEVTAGAAAPEEAVAAFTAALSPCRRGLLVVGSGGGGRDAALGLSAALGWPVLSSPPAFPRLPDPALVVHGDAVLRSKLAASTLRPDVVVHAGTAHASRVLSEYLATLAEEGVPQLRVDPYASFEDPERAATSFYRADPGALFRAAAGRLAGRGGGDEEFALAWRAADDAAEAVLSAELSGREGLTEPAVARLVYGGLPPGSTVFASSSMPVRDLEWYAPACDTAPRVLSNRGANGIDGVVSSALGAAAADKGGGATVGLLGDLAFFHDLSGLVHGRLESPPAATLVVVDNAGGGIFSFLPQAERLGRDEFERAFGTPQAPDVATVAAALGHRVWEVADAPGLAAALSASRACDGLGVVVVRSERADNVVVHRELNEAVVAALEEGRTGNSR